LHYNWYRHYDPTIGRFTQPDPLGFVDGPSVYAYGRSSPARFTDFDGREAVGRTIGGVAGGVGGAALCGPACGFAGRQLGRIIGDKIGDYCIAAKPPANAYNQDGPKAPGKPTEGDGFIDPPGGDDWVPNPNGRGNGWKDAKGDVWIPTGKGGAAHGGPHWDVQTPGGGYRNVYSGGNVR
jgi:uncharacterized protein RhaS with RHS repeats